MNHGEIVILSLIAWVPYVYYEISLKSEVQD